jgi:hypothetical protein
MLEQNETPPTPCLGVNGANTFQIVTDATDLVESATGQKPLSPAGGADRDEARRHLNALGIQLAHFQTFDDNAQNKDQRLARVRYGTFEEYADLLERINRKGGGVFVTINQTRPSETRRKEDVIAVRALFVDLDRAPIEPVLKWKLKPHLVVESSRNKFHPYWRTDGSVPLDQFTELQRRLIALFNADKSVNDLPRVLRIAGFWHQKVEKDGTRSEPFKSQIFLDESQRAAYSLADFEAALRESEGEQSKGTSNVVRSPVKESESAPARARNVTGAQASTKTARKYKIGEPALLALGASREERLANCQSVLDAVPIDDERIADYSTFANLIVAMKGASGGDEEFLEKVFLPYLRGNPRNKTAEMRAKWKGVTEADIGWDYLTKILAREVGAQFAFDEPADESNMPQDPGEKALTEACQRYAYCENLDRFADLTNGTLITRTTFNARHTEIAAPGSSGTRSADNVFLYDRRTRKVWAPTYRPGQGPVMQEEINGKLQDAVNLWRPSSLAPKRDVSDEGVKPWLDHITLLFGPEGTPEREHFLNWNAYVLQNPGEKINHALVLLGRQGIGKDTVLRPLTGGVGKHNYWSGKPEVLFGQFTHLLEHQLIIVQEMFNFERRELYNKMKEWLAAPPDYLEVNRKHMQPYNVPNIQCWVFLTNHENAIALEEDDRRFWVHRCLPEQKPPPEYFKGLHDWFDGGGDAACVGWLLQRDLSAFNPHAEPPMTEAKRTMLYLAHSEGRRWFNDMLGEDGAFCDRRTVTVDDLMQVYGSPKSANNKHAEAALKSAGFKPVHRVRLPDGSRRQIWVRDPSVLHGQLSPDALKERYLAEADAFKKAAAAKGAANCGWD